MGNETLSPTDRLEIPSRIFHMKLKDLMETVKKNKKIFGTVIVDRDDGRIIKVKGIYLDNRFVVPYNPTLLFMFQAHINVEKCNQFSTNKYLFKYISKGNDKVVAAIHDNNEDGSSEHPVDEI
ncbi:uncharacterized protein LOC114734567 [Neltuma alba]|uniref:uncharacterized protein LOC114734562 n=1 Tax=Neltuma alba TaxID=207710 RepID=UPI0010A56C86|nr:uncharacterized protein LOC114734562 [Prosopis alba]XP_028778015.1 uncharacterized protein LOC114734567 [Prosopis alba]